MSTEAELQAKVAELEVEVLKLRKALGELGGGISSVTNSAKSMLGPFGSLADATIKGSTGISAYNNALDLSGKELEKLVGSASIFGVAITAMSDSVKLYVKLAGAQADELMKSYQGLASVGAAGKADLIDVYETMRKFGSTSREELPKFTQMLGQNSEMLAKLGGTVSQGIKQFADVSASIQQTGLQTEFMNMGMSVDSINKGIAGYLKIQTQAGAAQRMTQDQLNAGAADYIRNLDVLSKLTGKSAEALQKEREERQNDEKYMLMRRQQQQVVARGGAEGERMAAMIKQQEALLDVVKSQYGDETAKAIMRAMGPYGTQSEEGVKLLRSLPETYKLISEMNRGGKVDNEEIAAVMARESTKNITAMGGLVQAGGTTGGLNMLELMRGENARAAQDKKNAEIIAAGGAPTTATQDAKTQQEAQTKATGESVAAMVELIQKQRQATTDLSDMSTKGIVPAAHFMGVLAGKVRDVTDLLPGTRPRSAAEINQQGGGALPGQPGYQSDLRYPGKTSDEIGRKAQEDVANFISEINKSLQKAQAAAEQIGTEGVRLIKDMLREMSTGPIAGDRAAEERSRRVPGGTTGALPASEVLAINRGYVNIASADNIRFPEMPTSYRSSLDPDMMSRISGMPVANNTTLEKESTTRRADPDLIASNMLVSEKLDDLIDIMRRGVGYQRKISMSASA